MGSIRPIVVIGLEETDYISIAYDQLRHLENVYVLPKREGRIPGIRRILMSYKLNGVIRLPGQSSWAKRDVSAIRSLNVGQPIFLVFESREGLNPHYIETMKACFPQSELYLNVLNPLDDVLKGLIDRVSPLYHDVISCNEHDAVQNGWLYHPDCYSHIDLPASGAQSTDVCFIAADKGRADFAWELFTRFKARGMKCDFVIIGEELPGKRDDDFQYISKMMPYMEYLGHIANSKCILEITVGGTDYCTLRTMEALVHGKKLVTTNKSVAKERFYDSRQIDIITSAPDVDAVDLPSIDYERQEDLFAPSKLVDFIRSRMR